jgi:TonB family protein
MARSLTFALLLATLASRLLVGQSHAAALIDSARAELSAGHTDSASALLHRALDSAAHATLAERKSALVWEGVAQFFQGQEDGARGAFRAALALDTTLAVQGLERLSPELARIFREEKEAATGQGDVYLPQAVDDAPRRLSGPPVDYPTSLMARRVEGVVHVSAIIDTTGRVEATSVEVLATPDSGLIDPVKRMMLASQFAPGRRHGAAVRTMIQLAVDVRAPHLGATELVTAARAALAAHQSDSARLLLALALDTTLTHATEGERSYALLVRGTCHCEAGPDSAARSDLREGLALYQDLTGRGVDLAPFLRRLADSVRLATRARTGPAADLPPPTTVGAVDVEPSLLTHPAIRYPPEMQALRVAATVVVEAALDTTGRVAPGTATVVTSENHAFDAEALSVIRGSRYRPARLRGRPVRVVIRQVVSFANY